MRSLQGFAIVWCSAAWLVATAEIPVKAYLSPISTSRTLHVAISKVSSSALWKDELQHSFIFHLNDSGFKEQNCRAVFQFLCGRFLRMDAGGQCLHQTNQGIAERCFLFPQETGCLSLSCRQSAKTSHKQTERAPQFIASPRLKLEKHFCHSCTGPSGAHYSRRNFSTQACAHSKNLLQTVLIVTCSNLQQKQSKCQAYRQSRCPYYYHATEKHG